MRFTRGILYNWILNHVTFWERHCLHCDDMIGSSHQYCLWLDEVLWGHRNWTKKWWLLWWVL